MYRCPHSILQACVSMACVCVVVCDVVCVSVLFFWIGPPCPARNSFLGHWTLFTTITPFVPKTLPCSLSQCSNFSSARTLPPGWCALMAMMTASNNFLQCPGGKEGWVWGGRKRRDSAQTTYKNPSCCGAAWRSRKTFHWPFIGFHRKCNGCWHQTTFAQCLSDCCFWPRTTQHRPGAQGDKPCTW